MHISKNSAITSSSSAIFQKSLLCGVSLIAASVLVGPRVAHAQTIFGTETNPVISFGNNITVESTGYLAGAPGLLNPVNVTTSLITIENGGQIISSNGIVAISDALVNTGSIIALSNSGTISGVTAGIYNKAGSISVLTNAGTVTGTGSYGIDNTGSIGALSNLSGGAIYGNSTGVYNVGTIGQLTNSGSISGYYHAVSNQGGLGTLTNAVGGVLSSASYSAVTNSGSIGQLTNNGLIEGNRSSGVYNGGGSISQLTNNGSIYGYTDGVGNGSTIGALINNSGATITGGREGIINYAGTIGNLTNAGTITGTNSYGVGVENGSSSYGSQAATIGTLTNSGVITGGTIGVENFGTITSLINQLGGTIAGGTIGVDNVGTNLKLLLPNVVSVDAPTSTGTATISLLSNSGSISGSQFGIENGGAIGTLTNTGTGVISAGADQFANYTRAGIYNTGSIGALTNAGSISLAEDDYANYGPAAGVLNLGTIHGLNNTGTISASFNDFYNYGVEAGVANTGAITTLTNGGKIAAQFSADYNSSSAVQAGIYNTGGVGTLTNSGSISAIFNGYDSYYNAVQAGIDNIGSIGTFTNGGSLNATGQMIYSDGLQAALANSGTISSFNNTGTISFVDDNYYSFHTQAAVYNNGTIGTLTNSGLISANSSNQLYADAANAGIFNEGTIGTLTNKLGGAIIGEYTGIQTDGVIVTLTNAGTIAGSVYTGIYNDGTIGGLTNNGGGIIVGGDTGIYNDYIFGSLTNSGTIAGNYDQGIYNDGQINTLTNISGGLISGGDYGIYNNGYIGSLTNSGAIVGNYGAGIYNEGYIPTITNNKSGLIQGATAGIYNYSQIDVVSNSGTIHGGNTGFYNEGYVYHSRYSTYTQNDGGNVGTLTNSGLISGNSTGIYNGGVINTLTNIGTLISGVLTGGTISGGSYGIYNEGTGYVVSSSSYFYDTSGPGTIGVLTNSGLIAANGTGVYNDGDIGTLINSGTILGNYGIGNAGSGVITSLTNSKLIAGYYTGIYNSDVINVITNSGTIVGGHDAGVANSGFINLLTNSGTIIGEYEGINNNGNIGVISNTGLIEGTGAVIATPSSGLVVNSAGNAGIYNGNVVGSLTNFVSGSIIGKGVGVYNYGLITSLTNAGLISGGYTGVNNHGSISVLNNTGIIQGLNSTGIFTNRYIGTLTNSGQIYGYDHGIENSGTIGKLTNSGTIRSVTSSGINNGGTIGALTNTGLISSASSNGIYSNGTIGTLSNSGTISGRTGIYISGHGTTITNTGTIIGTGGDAIDLGVKSSLILSTGSDVIGSIYGGGTGSTITLEGTDAMSNTFADFGAGSSLTVAQGADWEANGSWTIASVTNNGEFQAGKIGAPLNLTGNFTQSSTGELVIIVTPKTSSQFDVTGNVNLAGGVIYELAPGIYGGVKDYEYIVAGGTIAGGFTTSTITSAAAGSYDTYINPDPSANLIINAPFTVGLVDQSIFGDQTQALAGATQDVTSDILGKATEGGSNADPACAAESPATLANLSASNDVANTSRIASTLANVFCGEGGWVEATGSLNHTDASGGAAAYDADTEGFLAGVDKPLGAAGTRLGLAVGFDHTSLTDKAGGSGSMGTTRVALYGSQPLGNFTLAATVGYGFASNSTSRNSDFGSFNENNSLGIFNAGLQGSTHVSLGTVDLAPAAGVKIASVQSTNFSEPNAGTAGAFAVSGRTAEYTSVQPYVTARFSESFLTSSNVVISPDALIGYEYEADDHGVATNVLFASGGSYQTLHSNLDQGDALISAGLSAVKNNWTLYVTYTGRISGNWETQTGEAGLRIKF